MANSYLLGRRDGRAARADRRPAGFQPDPAIVARAEAIAAADRRQRADHRPRPSEAVAGLPTCVATDTWVSMGQESDAAGESIFVPVRASTAELLAQAAPDAIVLHCLPAYRGKEIAAEVIDGPQSAVWDEAENRRHVQKAVLVFLEPPREATAAAPVGRRRMTVTRTSADATAAHQDRPAGPDHRAARAAPGALPGRAGRAAGDRRVAGDPGHAVPRPGRDRRAAGPRSRRSSGLRGARRRRRPDPAGAGSSPRFESRLARLVQRGAGLGRGVGQPGGAADPARAPRSTSPRRSTGSAGTAILGTIAGDDTILLITRSPVGGTAIAETFSAMSAHRQAGAGCLSRRPEPTRTARPNQRIQQRTKT